MLNSWNVSGESEKCAHAKRGCYSLLASLPCAHITTNQTFFSRVKFARSVLLRNCRVVWQMWMETSCFFVGSLSRSSWWRWDSINKAMPILSLCQILHGLRELLEPTTYIWTKKSLAECNTVYVDLFVMLFWADQSSGNGFHCHREKSIHRFLN